jgi:beta-alanine--pyruvate transaminase
MQNNLDAYWMPFTANRQFKAAPRMLVSADRMHYRDSGGRAILDGTAGLWCVNAGHNRVPIVEAIREAAGLLDYAPSFQMGHPAAFRLAERLAALAPGPLNHVFFAGSGSESVDSALKIALACHQARGEGQRTRFIGRERGYHGVGFGGISVGGIVNNRRSFGPLLPGVDHLPHTHDLGRNAFSRGQPQYGAELADQLERMIGLHGAETIAAVIVEPLAGSTGVLVPPVGYLERLRALCDRHRLLLIFDEVITGFGRLGAPFAASRFGVVPDLMTVAKGLTNGAVPMGAVLVSDSIHRSLMQGPPELIELYHGYTWSGHPLACAAANASLDVYQDEGLFERAASLESVFADAVHGLRGKPHIIDIRNLGLVAGIELQPRPGAPGARAYELFVRCFEAGLLIRTTGDIVALSPPLIIDEAEIARMVEIISDQLQRLD